MRPLVCRLVLALVCLSAPLSAAADAPAVRVAYIVPTDRAPQEGYEQRITALLHHVREFYAVQMERHGLGRHALRLAEGPNGAVDIRLIRPSMTAEELSEGGHARYRSGPYWDRALACARAAGIEPWTDGEVWLLIAEAHTQDEDGSIIGATAQGAGTPRSGVALVSGDKLALGDPALLSDERPYDGLRFEGLGPVALQQGKSFPWYAGDTVGGLAASRIGSVAHELGHCFQLSHQYLSDANFNGTLMGNGFRGWRGYALPERFPDEDARMTDADALMLSLSPFFDGGPPLPGPTPPAIVEAGPEGEIELVGGQVEVRYRVASSGPGVALVTLENGIGRDWVGIVDHAAWPEHPAEAQGVLRTSFFEPDQDDTWRLCVLDAHGNVAERHLAIRVRPGANAAPQPFLRASRGFAEPGAALAFDAEQSRDPEGAALQYAWQLGDGSSDEGEHITHAFAAPGLYRVVLRATDPEGASATVSQTVWVR